MYVCMYVCMYECMYVCMHVCMYVCIYMYVCVYVCMHVCMHFFCDLLLGMLHCTRQYYMPLWFLITQISHDVFAVQLALNIKSVYQFFVWHQSLLSWQRSLNSFWYLDTRSSFLTGQVPICCWMTSRCALSFGQWNRSVTLCVSPFRVQVGNGHHGEWHIPEVVFKQLILLMMSTGLLETCKKKSPATVRGGPRGSG